MKIEKISFSETADIPIMHPVDETPLIGENDKPMTVTVYSRHADAFKDKEQEFLDARIGKKGLKKLSAARIRREKLDLILACVISFNNLDFGDGLIATEAAGQTLKDHPWLLEQLDTAIGDNEYFLEKTGKKSKKS